jgi:kumamolisin
MAQKPVGHRRVERTQRQPMPGTTRTGPADPAVVVSVTIGLRRRPSAPPLPLADILKQPPGHRAYISREEFGERYGADPADVARVEQFAREYGMAVDEVSVARRTVKVSGTVEQLNRAFAVDLGVYESDDKKISYRGREGHVQIPEGLADAVQGVFGLDNRQQARPLYRQFSGPAQSTTPLTPPQVASLYGFPSGSAAGQCIGLIEFGGGYQLSDITAFFGGLGKATPTISAVGIDGATNSPGSSYDIEVALDIGVAGSVAPGATLAVYFAPWTEQGWVDVLSSAVHDTTHRPSVLSISWGWPELQNADGLTWTQAAMDHIDATLQEAVALGVTVLAATGDYGANFGIGGGKVHTLFPASDPFITACGGTSISDVSGGNFDEVVWNDGSGATGGGVSDCFNLPAWQTSVGVPKSLNDGKVRRGVPDVAGNADESSGYILIVGGKPTVPIGGTSAVAPLYAGLLALVNAQFSTPVGYLNPTLYGLAGPYVFRDITSGNNSYYGVTGYQAGPGWDACTGLGSIHGAALLASLQGQYDWLWCNKCQALCFGGGTTLGPCPAGGNHDHTGSDDYVLVHDIPPTSIAQANWKWCNKCQVLCFAGDPTPGPCAAGGSHNHNGSFDYSLFQGPAPGQAGQANWRWCDKCEELCFAGNPSPGACPAGGNHLLTNSSNYVVLTPNLSFGPAGQANWRWCNKCQALSFAGNPTPGPCPAGGNHDHTGSSNYVLNANVAPDQDEQGYWRWCNKCQVLAFAASASPGNCAAGGDHDHTGSAFYILIDNVTAGPQEQSDWRWCNKCQELAFAGNASPGPCPAGGNHDTTTSANLVLAYA